jgi:hypothetical protein
VRGSPRPRAPLHPQRSQPRVPLEHTALTVLQRLDRDLVDTERDLLEAGAADFITMVQPDQPIVLPGGQIAIHRRGGRRHHQPGSGICRGQFRRRYFELRGCGASEGHVGARHQPVSSRSDRRAKASRRAVEVKLRYVTVPVMIAGEPTSMPALFGRFSERQRGPVDGWRSTLDFFASPGVNFGVVQKPLQRQGRWCRIR